MARSLRWFQTTFPGLALSGVIMAIVIDLKAIIKRRLRLKTRERNATCTRSTLTGWSCVIGAIKRPRTGLKSRESPRTTTPRCRAGSVCRNSTGEGGLRMGTQIDVRVIAKGGKYLGDDIGGALVTVEDVRTGGLLARGTTSGRSE